MNMPGFNGEASLIEVKDGYYLSLRDTEEGGTVVPQLLCYSCSYDPWTGRYECGWHPCVIRARL